ncbi:hypothetical protein BDP27DRAFT_1319860 [Rhodocollybia butyracea]|uniref:BAG domain-containing protein n=1 Tax=Rhodocollybia butyracea TaxID=206335 RepID=A0A9P5Q0V3_9AGAR|nr:hypothetical protein BDP27DRAFT_1319860 [Rhodocollybia butyracea]
MFHFQPTRVSSFPTDFGYSRPEPSRQSYLSSVAAVRAAEADREEEDILRRLEEIQLRKQHDHLFHRRSQYNAFSPYSCRALEEEELELEYIRRKREEEAQLLAVTQKREELKLQELTRLRQEEEARLRALRHEAQQFEAVQRTRSLQGLPSSKKVLPRSDSDVLISLNQLFGNEARPVEKPKQNKPHFKAAPCSLNPKNPVSLDDLFSDFIQHLQRSQPEQKPATEEKPKQAPRASLPSPQTLEEVLRLMFNPQPLVSSDARKVAAKPVAQVPELKEKPQVVNSGSRPVSTLSLKEQLEARLHSDESVEIQDTIQALLASLSDSHAPAATSVPDASNHKGKGKASEPQPSPSTSNDVPKALEAVQNIEASFIALQDDFEFPLEIDFSPTSSRSSSPSRDDSASIAESDTATIRKLEYTSRNHPLRSYEQSLTRLLAQLDEIESQGNADLRIRRKAVVALVEGALEELEQKVEARWNKWNKRHLRVDREDELTQEPTSAQDVDTAGIESITAASEPLDATVSPSDIMTSTIVHEKMEEERVFDVSAEVIEPTEDVEDSVFPLDTEGPIETSLPHNEEKVDTESLPSVPKDVSEMGEPTEVVDAFLLGDTNELSGVATKLSGKDLEDAGSDWSEVEA